MICPKIAGGGEIEVILGEGRGDKEGWKCRIRVINFEIVTEVFDFIPKCEIIGKVFDILGKLSNGNASSIIKHHF